MKTILAAIDLDSNAERVLDAAIDLAMQYRAVLILATVETELPGMEGATDEELKKEIQLSYDEALTRLKNMADDLDQLSYRNL